MDISASFEDVSEHSSNHLSTPITYIETRKRKLVDSCSSSPKFSSTFNESLVSNFKEFGIEGSLPVTPEKQLKLATNPVTASPIEESRRILYSSLKVIKPERRVTVRERNVCYSARTLLDKILNTNVIMDVIFKYLSGGDLFRFSKVSHSFDHALARNRDALHRYKKYTSIYRVNKENYVITPPGSPEKGDSSPRTSSATLNKFIKVGNCLSKSQSLTKCRRCGDVAVVDNDVSQCQNVNGCGLIYCLRCSSFSETGPKDFHDKCGHAVLRPKLANVSNCMEESFYTLNISQQDSGFYSEGESPPKVRRNLFYSTPKSTTNSSMPEMKSRRLGAMNRKMATVNERKRKQLSYVPVMTNKEREQGEVDCDSPPRYEYGVGSMKSKKNLKRLTR